MRCLENYYNITHFHLYYYYNFFFFAQLNLQKVQWDPHKKNMVMADYCLLRVLPDPLKIIIANYKLHHRHVFIFTKNLTWSAGMGTKGTPLYSC